MLVSLLVRLFADSVQRHQARWNNPSEDGLFYRCMAGLRGMTFSSPVVMSVSFPWLPLNPQANVPHPVAFKFAGAKDVFRQGYITLLTDYMNMVPATFAAAACELTSQYLTQPLTIGEELGNVLAAYSVAIDFGHGVGT